MTQVKKENGLYYEVFSQEPREDRPEVARLDKQLGKKPLSEEERRRLNAYERAGKK